MYKSKTNATMEQRASILRQFFLFSGVSLVVFLVVIGSIIIPKVQSSYNEFLINTNTLTLNLERQELQIFLDDRVTVLEDIASQQGLITAALLGDSNNLDAASILNSAKILGISPEVALYGIDEKVLYSNFDSTSYTLNTIQELVEQMLRSDDPTPLIDLVNQDEKSKLLITVPLLYGQGIEGILVTALPFKLEKAFPLNITGQNLAMKVTKGNVSIGQNVDLIADPFSQTTTIEPYGITLEVITDRAPSKIKETELIRSYALYIFLASFLAFGLTVLAGYRLIVTPLRQLLAADTKIHQQDRDLQLIFDNVPVRIWYKDDKNRILRLNKQAAESMGRTVKNTEGKDTYDLFPEMAAKYHEDDLAVIKSEKPTIGIIEEYTPLGAERGWIRTDKMPFHDRETGERGVFVVSQDITSSVEAQEDLRVSEERFALAAEGSSVGIWDWMHVGNDEQYWSPQFYKLLGYENNEVASDQKLFTSFLHPDDLQRCLTAAKNYFKQIAPFDIEYRLRLKNGTYRWFRATAQAAWDETNTPTRVVGSIQDIHERVEAEESLKAHAEELLRSNADLEQFAYVASHDLKAPLRGILNLTEWIEENIHDTVDDETSGYIRMLKTRVMRLESLLAGLLEYSRVGSGTSDIVQIDLNATIAQIVDILDGESKGFEFEYDLPPVVGIQSQLMQIFQNLIGNAIKHNADTPGKIVISHSADQTQDIFRVGDDGIGIPEEMWAKVFEMFQTLKPRDQVEGSGMGLAIVKKLITRRGGNIWLEKPTEGTGLIVCFSLPKGGN